MAKAYTSSNVAKAGTAVTVGAGESGTVISVPRFTFSAADAHGGVVIDLIVSASTVATGITAKLQTSQDGTNWSDSKTVSITNGVAAATPFTIKLLPTVAGDQTFLPLRPLGRVVVTSGAGDSCTIDAILKTECR